MGTRHAWASVHRRQRARRTPARPGSRRPPEEIARGVLSTLLATQMETQLRGAFAAWRAPELPETAVSRSESSRSRNPRVERFEGFPLSRKISPLRSESQLESQPNVFRFLPHSVCPLGALQLCLG